MTRMPKEYTPYFISNTIATEIPGDFKAYGTDYSEIGDNIIYFNSVPLERTVAFKAFIDSIKINLKKEADKIKKDDQNFTIIKEKTAHLSYDLTINIPAHSVNESRNNLAKIEELQRLILTPVSKAQTSTITEVDPDGNKTETQVSQTLGVSKRYGEAEAAIQEPIFTVLFKNLISSGVEPVSVPFNFDDMAKKGFPCYIESIKYDPDHEAGFFEYDSYLFPKNLKLSVTLNYDSQVLQEFSNNKTLRPFTFNGLLSKQDSGMFPFHSKTGLRKMNEIFSDGERIDTYIFISNTPKMNEMTLDTGLPREYDSASDLNSITPLSRFVLFKPFIESFSRTQNSTVQTEDAADYGIYKRVLKNGVSFGSLEYEITFNVVAKSVEEAKKNAAKIQTLCRLSLRKEIDGSQDFGTIFPDRLTEGNAKKNLMFYIPSMIERPGSGKRFTTSPIEMYERSVDLYLSDFSFEIENDFGYFEEGSKIFPKAYKITLKMEDPDNKLLREYKMEDLEAEKYVVAGKDGTSYLTEGVDSHLFPFNRKTVRIGGR